MRKITHASLIALTCLSSLAWAGETDEPQYQEEILVTTGAWGSIARLDVQFTHPMPGYNRFATVTVNLEQQGQTLEPSDRWIQAKQYEKYIGNLEVLLHEGRTSLSQPNARITIPRKVRYAAPYPDLERASFGILSGSDPDEKEYTIAAVSIPYAEESWRAACINVSEGKHYNPYKEMIITLSEDGEFSYEIETPALCDDALLGTGNFTPTE